MTDKYREPKKIIASETSSENNDTGSEYNSSSCASVNFYETVENNSYFTPFKPRIRVIEEWSNICVNKMDTVRSLLTRVKSQENIDMTKEEAIDYAIKLREQLKLTHSMICDMQKSEEEMKTRVEALQNIVEKTNINETRLPNSSNPTISIIDGRAIPFQRRKEIQQLMFDIPEFDGTSNVEAFLDQVKEIRSLVSTEESFLLAQKIRAQKLKKDAKEVAERIQNLTLNELSESLKIAFGIIGKDFKQLTMERNTMRQGQTERTENYIKRYTEMDRKIQRSIDQTDITFRDYRRREENIDRIKMFIRTLRTDIRIPVAIRKPEKLNDAYKYALDEEKIIRDDEEVQKYRQSRMTMIKRPAIISRPPIRSPVWSKQDQERDDTPLADRIKTNKNCSHCKSTFHNESTCWKKYPHLAPKKGFQNSRLQGKDPPTRKYLTHAPEEEEWTQDCNEQDEYEKEMQQEEESTACREDIPPSLLAEEAIWEDTDSS